MTMDDFVAQHHIEKVKLIPIDLAGAAFLCFRGGEKLLKSENRPIIIFECFERYCKRCGYSEFDVLLFLYNCGYRLERIEDYYEWIAYPV